MSSDIPGKPAWQRFLESTGGAAFITVVIGGILGQWITSTFQARNKERELSLTAYSEYLKQEQEIVKRAYELVGMSIAASDDLMFITTSQFDLDNFEGEERKKTALQKDEIKARYNEFDLKWRNERETLGLLMSYFHHGQPEVTEAWRKSQDAVTVYMDCALAFYSDHVKQPPNGLSSACVPERQSFRMALDSLSRSFEVARSHALDSIGAAAR